MTGVDADLATLRREAPSRKFGRDLYLEAFTRVEAELSRLREERDVWVASHIEKDKELWAAEARCARLQQALEHIESLWINSDRRPPAWWDIAREALAGPDTPADSPPPVFPGWTALPDELLSSIQVEAGHPIFGTYERLAAALRAVREGK